MHLSRRVCGPTSRSIDYREPRRGKLCAVADSVRMLAMPKAMMIWDDQKSDRVYKFGCDPS